MTDLIEGEIVEDLVPYQPQPPVTLWGTTDPAAVIEAATAAAQPLAAKVREQKLMVKIGASEHVRVEGWCLLGAMLGVFPVTVWSRKLEDGWEARVEARTLAGAIVGAAEAECLRSESTWANRDDYALRSMAQTRATSKALRQPLGFVMQLAGFNPTPAEEMPRPARQAKPKADKSDAMRTRIKELAVEADTQRGETKTAGEIEATVKTNWATTLAKLGETELGILGTDLKEWVVAGCKGEFRIVPF